MKNFFAVAAAVVAAVGVAPYLIDIVKRKTKPNVVSWTTWTLLTAIATAATFAADEPKTALLTLGSTVCSGLVVILGLKYGFAKFSAFDAFCWVGAVTGLGLWLIFDSPTLAIITTVSIDFLGVLPTIRHAWNEPGEETWQTFLAGVVAAMLTLVSLTQFSVDSLLYPLYLMLANAAVVGVVIVRRKQKHIKLSRHGVHETLHE